MSELQLENIIVDLCACRITIKTEVYDMSNNNFIDEYSIRNVNYLLIMNFKCHIP